MASKGKTLYFKPAKHQSLKAQVLAPRSPKLEGQRCGDLLLSNGPVGSKGTSHFTKTACGVADDTLQEMSLPGW